MDEAAVLAATYHDRLTVLRYFSYTDEKTGETKEAKNVVYQSVPCALSQSGNGVPARTGVVSQKDGEYVLFTMPGVRMEENDCAEVATQAGEIYQGRTGRTLVYAGSHGETRLKIEGVS